MKILEIYIHFLLHILVIFCQLKKFEQKNQIFCGRNVCPHAKAKLHLGKVLENGHIECPLHRYQFDLNSGISNTIDCGGLEVFPVKQEINDIYTGHGQGDVASTSYGGASIKTRYEAISRLKFPWLKQL